MAVISRPTFDKLKHYVSMRLQMGVPVVDADINELEDIRRYELQAFLKWFVGNGVPYGNNGFAIEPLDDPGRVDFLENFKIVGGSDGSTDNAGRCFVEGWDAIIESDLEYTNQNLFDSILATAYVVPQLSSLSEATADREDIVYLDIWEREVLAGETGDNQDIFDRDIIDPDIGIETCTRMKREWVVRVTQDNTTLPVNGDTVFRDDHVYYELARIKWTLESDGTTVSREIIDKRLTGLTIGSYYDTQQIIKDSFGTSYSLDHDGHPNLRVSLREAINALLRGAIPETPAEQIAINNTNNDYRARAVEDLNGDVWAFWVSDRNSSGSLNIWFRKYDHISASWNNLEEPLTNDTTASDKRPTPIIDKDGNIWVFWQSVRNSERNIWYNRRNHLTGNWDGEQKLTQSTVYNGSHSVSTDNISGDIWVFWTSDDIANPRINFTRFDYANPTEGWDSIDQFSSATNVKDTRPQAVSGLNGDLWLFWISEENIVTAVITKILCRKRVDGVWEPTIKSLVESPYPPEQTNTLVDNKGDVWIFWVTDLRGPYFVRVRYRKYNQEDTQWDNEVELHPYGENAEEDNQELTPFSIVDNNGDVWLYWVSNKENNLNVLYQRYTEVDGWGDPNPITTGISIDKHPYSIVDRTGSVWVFWDSTESGNADNWVKTFIPSI